MEKKEIFAKMNIKDYNNQLEKILVKKSFSSDIKNLLLDMLYKIENAYEDYKTVKVDVKEKRDILEELLEIIQKDCNTIEITKDSETVKTDKENSIIITPANTHKMLLSLYEISHKKFIVDKEYDLIKTSIESMLNCGYGINLSETIRDFDGWSWHISTKDIENLICNFIFQSLIIITGLELVTQWQTSNKEYYFTFESFLENKYKIAFSKEILKNINQMSILYFTEINEEERQHLIEKQKELQTEFEGLQDKKKYLQNLLEKKKQCSKEIENIDKIVNSDRLLKEEFIKRNEKLDFQHRIFSLSDLTEIMQKERNGFIKELNECSKKQEPMNYVKNKNQISDNLELLQELKLEENNSNVLEDKTKKLIEIVIKTININIKNVQEKKDIIDIIYKIRYYKLIFVKPEKQVKDFIDFEDIQKQAITEGCNKKVLNILSLDVEENYKIIKEIFKINIINLEEIYIEFKKQNEKIVLYIYDETNFDTKIEYDDIKDLNVKINKKIKLFT